MKLFTGVAYDGSAHITPANIAVSHHSEGVELTAA